MALVGGSKSTTQLVRAVNSGIEVPGVSTIMEVRVEVPGRAGVVSTFDVTVPRESRCSEFACPLPLSVGV